MEYKQWETWFFFFFFFFFFFCVCLSALYLLWPSASPKSILLSKWMMFFSYCHYLMDRQWQLKWWTNEKYKKSKTNSYTPIFFSSAPISIFGAVSVLFQHLREKKGKLWFDLSFQDFFSPLNTAGFSLYLTINFFFCFSFTCRKSLKKTITWNILRHTLAYL